MNQEGTMKYKLKRKLKKIGTFFLALLTLFSSLFGGMAGMPAPVVNVAAKEGTATVGMSQVMDCNKISALTGRQVKDYGRSLQMEKEPFA